MLRQRPYLHVLLFVLLVLASCEKKEQPIALPPAGAAQPGNVDMGEDYSKMIYYDFEHNTVVKTSALASWDLAFETGTDGRHVFLNGGMDVTVLNTHQPSFDHVVSPPSNNHSPEWHFDHPGGAPDKTGIGEWCEPGGNNSHGDVYIVQLGVPGRYMKVKFVSVNPQQYVIQYGDIASRYPVELVIPKSADCNFTYFSFTNGIVSPEPPKAAWDVVFTHYKDLVFDNVHGYDVGYVVAGALLNPEHTAAAADSTHDFASIDLAAAQALPAKGDRNAIGYDWKHFHFNSSGTDGTYEVNPRKVYVLHSRNGHLIKLHFLDFYHSGAKGSPSFESQILQ